LIPHLCVVGAADAIEFYKKAFGATEVMRMPAGGRQTVDACPSHHQRRSCFLDGRFFLNIAASTATSRYSRRVKSAALQSSFIWKFRTAMKP